MKIIQNIAEQEESVIVGRCSDYILRDRKDCLNVFIYADAEDREKRIIERYGENDKKDLLFPLYGSFMGNAAKLSFVS